MVVKSVNRAVGGFLLTVICGTALAAVIGCSAEQDKRVIIRSGCSDVEVAHDIAFSVEQIRDYLNAEGIELDYDSTSRECEYELVRADSNLTIDFALTDVELRETIDLFFR